MFFIHNLKKKINKKNELNQSVLEFKNIMLIVYYSNIALDIVKPVSHYKIPPWILLKPEIDISLSKFQKTETNPLGFF